jgi:hypothetical protein
VDSDVLERDDSDGGSSSQWIQSTSSSTAAGVGTGSSSMRMSSWRGCAPPSSERPLVDDVQSIVPWAPARARGKHRESTRVHPGVVTADGCEVITRFPAEELLVCGARYWTIERPLPTLRETESHLNTEAGRWA